MSGVAKDRNKYLCSCETLFIRCLIIFYKKTDTFKLKVL